MKSFNTSVDFGTFNDSIIVKISIYSKALHYRINTLKQIIDNYHKKQRKYRVTTPCGEYVCLDIILKAIQSSEHNIKKLEMKHKLHCDFMRSWTSSPFLYACFLSNKYE